MERVKALETALKEAKEGAMKDRKRWVKQGWEELMTATSLVVSVLFYAVSILLCVLFERLLYKVFQLGVLV